MVLQLPLTPPQHVELDLCIHWNGQDGGPTLRAVRQTRPRRTREVTVSLKGLLGLLDVEDPLRPVIIERHREAIADGRATAEAHRAAIARLTGTGDPDVQRHVEAAQAVQHRTRMMVRALGEARTLG